MNEHTSMLNNKLGHYFTESTPVSEEESIRMLVLLENGEQRLITFTLPKEACTIQEILEQVLMKLHNKFLMFIKLTFW